MVLLLFRSLTCQWFCLILLLRVLDRSRRCESYLDQYFQMRWWLPVTKTIRYPSVWLCNHMQTHTHTNCTFLISCTNPHAVCALHLQMSISFYITFQKPTVPSGQDYLCVMCQKGNPVLNYSNKICSLCPERMHRINFPSGTFAGQLIFFSCSHG